MEKLKPCPFCGGTDLHFRSVFAPDADIIVCYDCLTTFSQQELTCEEDLIKAWNRRPDKSKAIKLLADGIMDINLEEIKSHNTDDRMEQWIKSWRAYMQKWLWVLDQELKEWNDDSMV